MSFNAKKIMQEIFEKLLLYSLYYEEYEIESEIIDKPRWINGNTDDLEYLTKTTLKDVIEFLPNSKALTLKFDNKHYFAIINVPKITKLPHFIKEIDENKGLITSVIYHSGIMIKDDITPNIIYNEIAYQYDGQVGYYSGHDINDILNVLQPINIFEIINYENEEIDIIKLIGSISSLNNNLIALSFESEILNEFSTMFEYNSTPIPFQNILNSLFSTTYQHSFLELYKCIESLFQIVYIVDLYKEVKPKTNLIEFLRAIDTRLKWRPTEFSTIQKIFSETPDGILAYFNNFSLNPESIGKWFYETRNKIVHLKQLQQEINLSDKEWNKLIYATLRLIEYWFEKYKLELKTAANNVYKSLGDEWLN